MLLLSLFCKHEDSVYVIQLYCYLYMCMHIHLHIYLLFEVSNKFYYDYYLQHYHYIIELISLTQYIYLIIITYLQKLHIEKTTHTHK